MFVRFRRHGRRLCPGLTQTLRVRGKPQNEHMASLGSVDATVSVCERLAFTERGLMGEKGPRTRGPSDHTDEALSAEPSTRHAAAAGEPHNSVGHRRPSH